MKISYNWLKEFIDLELSPEETAEKLTLIGLEVEEVEEYGNLLEGVIVGEVLEVHEHPNADRLRLCQVNLGNETVQIACGADNVASGQKVPVATVGTTLPLTDKNGNPVTIRQAELRGEPSEGMICAEDELELGSDHSGIMVLDDDLEVGTPLHQVFDLQKDAVIDIEITPNRPDATCHLGVARDLAAALDLELTKPFDTDFEEAEPLQNFVIEIKNPEKCHRYVGKIIENVSVGESPAWLKNRLQALGVRPVNNVVDVTNYVLLEMGQPLHAFDKEQLQGNKIVVQDFDREITFETLDHIERSCAAGTLFICDGKKPVAIAGVMGGLNSEVSEETTDILLESAYFDPATIRKTANEQSLQTDASYRYERGIDPQLQRIAAERAAQLIAQTTGGIVADRCSDVHPVPHEPVKINLRKSYTNRLLGTDFTLDEIKNLLSGLELSILEQNDDSITYEAPSFRPDLQREVDIIEEVGRLYDYNNIPAPTHSTFLTPEPISDWEKLQSKIKEEAKGLRFREIYSNSLISEENAERLASGDEMLHTLNPISTDMTTLRPSLLHGFLSSAAYNFNRDAKGVRFFEMGHVFRNSQNGTYYKGIEEESHILFGLAGLKNIEHWQTDPQKYTIFDLKAAINSFLTTLDLDTHVSTDVDENNHLTYFINDTSFGEAYAVDQSLREVFEFDAPAFVAEFSISKIYKLKQNLPVATYEPVSKFPAFEFDFAVIVDNTVRAQTLLKQIAATAGDKLDDIQIFDVFEGESLGKDKKSIAFRLSFLDKNKTLTINDIEPIIKKVLDELYDKFSAKLRS
ncbi:MAG TPA: phenylalanine--tRNA ligase subunit beta [Balneolaceae bacterium]|nr:phenylalanine--tRNA ligase subunit beta [Balneolaceae bacterium]